MVPKWISVFSKKININDIIVEYNDEGNTPLLVQIKYCIFLPDVYFDEYFNSYCVLPEFESSKPSIWKLFKEKEIFILKFLPSIGSMIKNMFLFAHYK